jgi:hypothetical protein
VSSSRLLLRLHEAHHQSTSENNASVQIGIP